MAGARGRHCAEETVGVSSEIEPAGEAALAILGEDSFVKALAEDIGKSTMDALARRVTRWAGEGARSLWTRACGHVRRSGRAPTEPRVQAAIEITKYGAAEERPDLRGAYENLAARSMTEDEWEHDYEEYVRQLGTL